MKGQIVLITILILSIAMTVSLSLIARMNIDVTMTNDLSDSVKAFAAAEAGVERSLKSGNSIESTTLTGTDTTYQTDVNIIGGAVSVFELPKITSGGSTETVWFVPHNADGTLDEATQFTEAGFDLCWIHDMPTPAVAVTALYKRGSNYFVAKEAYDADAARAGTNYFTFINPSATGCDLSTVYRKTVNFVTDFSMLPSDTILMVRLRPVYNKTKFYVKTVSGLPQQGKRIESTGSAASGITRKITVYQLYAAPGSLFDSVLYSQGTLSQ